jgi:hypothetical protein
MSFPGYLQDLSQLIEYPQRLLSITDDDDPVQTKEEKLIEDSESSYQSPGGSTLAPMISLDSFPITSYYADLASLLDTPDPKPHPTIPDLRALSTLSQNFAPNLARERPGETTSLTENMPSMSTSKDADSLPGLCISTISSKIQTSWVKNEVALQPTTIELFDLHCTHLK